jgi:hypothetical protein
MNVTRAHPYQSTLAAKVAALFHSEPNIWIGGRRLAGVAGMYGWRTRVSDIRRAPYSMRIRNRQRTIRKADGARFVISEYRYEPVSEGKEGAAVDARTPAAAV